MDKVDIEKAQRLLDQGVTARHYAFRSEDHTVKIFESFVAMI